MYIQGDFIGKENISGGESIGHYEKKRLYEHASDSDWLARESCLNLKIQIRYE